MPLRMVGAINMETAMTPQELVAAIPVPCVFVTNAGLVGAISPATETLFGTAILWRHYITAFRQPDLIDRIEAVLAGGRAQTGSYMGRDHERDTTFRVTISPLIDDEGHPGALVFFDDVTHLEEAGARRSEFVANVSHELRTPLTAIAGFIETLRGPAREDAEARARFLEIMERETHRMNRLVDDLLSLSRVEDQERVRPVEMIDLAELLTSMIRGLDPQAEARRVSLVLTGTDHPAQAPGDPDQLTQVFTNLVENAIKYGREGGRVEVSLERLEDAKLLRGPALRITVRDDGEGIPPRHLGRLTERFYRVDSHRSRGMGGTGLGLAIVKHIVSRHRGRLRIESEVGKGSTFTVYLPLE